MSSMSRWKLFSSAMTMSLFVRSSGRTFETETSTEPPGAAGGGCGAPGRAGAGAESTVRLRPPPRAPPCCAWKIWFTLSAMSFADANRICTIRTSSPAPARSIASMSRSMRRMLSAMSVMMSMLGGIDWMSAPWGEMKFPMIPRS
jgi:hypothetical protein